MQLAVLVAAYPLVMRQCEGRYFLTCLHVHGNVAKLLPLGCLAAAARPASNSIYPASDTSSLRPQVSGLRAAELVLVMGDAHVYADHVEPLQQQLKQQPFPFPVRGCLLGPAFNIWGLRLA